MDDPRLPVEDFADSVILEDPSKTLNEGVVVGKTDLDGCCNLIYQYGQSKLLYLTKHEFLQYKPSIGHVGNETSFPVGQRLNYQLAAGSVRIEKPRDMGRYSFYHARCVRGFGVNEGKCYIDLLGVMVPINDTVRQKVPEGVAFVAKLDYDYDVPDDNVELPTRIHFRLLNFVDLSLEDIPFMGCRWEKRDVQSYLPDQLPFDYTRLYVTLPKFNYFAIYIGNNKFVSVKNGRVYIEKGIHGCKVELVVGNIYLIQAVPNRLSIGPELYSTSIFDVTKETFKREKVSETQTVSSLVKAAKEEELCCSMESLNC